jgi:hypothetical protein
MMSRGAKVLPLSHINRPDAADKSNATLFI